MKCKGRYVALVEVDFEADTDGPRSVDFEEMNNRLHNGWMEKTMKTQIFHIFKGNNPKITVTTQYADLYEVKNEN